jgi:LmbE family N-acetylglucosaminyl deacetylase
MIMRMNDYQADILAIAAHRDDVEQTCGGTLLKMAERGYRTTTQVCTCDSSNDITTP